mmetsp:Transcript_2676/g.6787  ORF Transcript_2676/g.6787 Transcript_2676/m.6787 type:complete len:240 (+) Transcript_2676:338-1057(+)
MYCVVPEAGLLVLRVPMVEVRRSRARPKSASLATPLSVSSTLAGFRSRCMTVGCRYARPAAMSRAMASTLSRSRSALASCTTSRRLVASSSCTTHTLGGTRLAARMRTMLGWEQRAMISTSLRSVARWALDSGATTPWCATLMAQRCPLYTQPYTLPNAPAPMKQSDWMSTSRATSSSSGTSQGMGVAPVMTSDAWSTPPLPAPALMVTSTELAAPSLAGHVPLVMQSLKWAVSWCVSL